MRKLILAVLAAFAAASIGCGGSGSGSNDGLQPIHHPTLDQDYSSSFAGVWTGTGTVVMGGQVQTSSGSQEITRTGFNTLAVTQMCPGANGIAGLDSPTTFSIDPLRCAPIQEPCGPVTITYLSATGELVLDTLTMTLSGTAAGCGISLEYTMTFSGTRTAVAGTGDGESLIAAVMAPGLRLAY